MGEIKHLEKDPTTEWTELADTGKRVSADNGSVEAQLKEFGAQKILYKKNQAGDFVLYDLYDKDRENEYEGELCTLPLHSAYAGWEEWEEGTEFVNIEGSTGDPTIYSMAWINVYEFVVRIVGQDPGYRAQYCCTDHKIYYPSNTQTLMCRGPFVGGHVIQGMTSIYPEVGADVYLLPICQAHNTSGAHGTGYYMKLLTDHIAVKLEYMVRN